MIILEWQYLCENCGSEVRRKRTREYPDKLKCKVCENTMRLKGYVQSSSTDRLRGVKKEILHEGQGPL